MRMRIVIAFTAAAAGVVLFPPHGRAEGEAGADIAGTWRLVSREMADPKARPPMNLVGLLTFTAEYRNFHVSWADAQGKRFFRSSVSKYKLTEESYSETCLQSVSCDERDGKGVRYDTATGSAEATRTTEGVEIQLPLFGEPRLAFRGDRMTATVEGQFTDRWERVK
jgi:hypothetical protein